jgi:RimJ/RimL family protein N-acetyltransferase
VEWHPPEPRLEADGIALRPFRVGDAAAVVDACRDPAILRFTFMQDGLTEAAAVEWIVRSNSRWLDGYPRFAIVHPGDDRLLGQVGLKVNVRHVSAEGHYWVKASDHLWNGPHPEDRAHAFTSSVVAEWNAARLSTGTETHSSSARLASSTVATSWPMASMMIAARRTRSSFDRPPSAR